MTLVMSRSGGRGSFGDDHYFIMRDSGEGGRKREGEGRRSGARDKVKDSL